MVHHYERCPCSSVAATCGRYSTSESCSTRSPGARATSATAESRPTSSLTTMSNLAPRMH